MRKNQQHEVVVVNILLRQIVAFTQRDQEGAQEH